MSNRYASSWLSFLAATVLSLTMIQVLVAMMPELHWDVSPLWEPEAVPAVALGPSGVAWLTVLSMIVLTTTLAVCRVIHIAWQWPALVLGGIGCITAGWHLLTGDGTDAFRCNAWIGAIALGLAACHLSQHEAPRRILSAGLIALVLPLLLGAVYSVYVDHPATVRFFLEREAQAVTQRGWEWNSPQHLIYKRRLMQAEAGGSFGFANTFGSMMTALTLLAGGVALAHLRQVPRKRAGVTLLLTLVGLVALMLSGARGAILTLLLVGALLLLMSWRALRPRWLMVLSMLLLLLPVGVVMMRLSVGPPGDVEGERSLLFRGFYWQGAANLVMHEPMAQTLLGTGPSGFKDLHARYKHPLNPEDVASTHNVFIDWLVMLGVGGLAWSMLLLHWLVRACSNTVTHNHHAASAEHGCSKNPPLPPGESQTRRGGGRGEGVAVLSFGILHCLFVHRASSGLVQRASGESIALNHEHQPLATIDPRWLGWIALAALPAGLTQYLVQSSTMYLERSLLWLLALGAFIFTATLLAQASWFTDRGLRWGAFASALALLVHNQIEMTFFHPGSVTIALVLLGVAGTSASSHRSATHRVAPATVSSLSSAGSAVRPPLPPGESQTRRGGGRREGAATPVSIRFAKFCETMMLLVVLLLTLLLVFETIRTTRIQYHLATAADLTRQRQLPPAVDELKLALQLRPDPHVTRSLAEITLATASNTQAWQQRAAELQPLFESGKPVLRDRLILVRMQAQLADHLYTLATTPQAAQQAAQQAVDHWRRLQALEPFNPHTAATLAQALERAGQTDAALEMYRLALVLSDRAYLDPLTQLNPAQRRRIENQLNTSP